MAVGQRKVGQFVWLMNPGDITLSATDIEIGAVEQKDGDTDNRANIKAANTARTTSTLVLAVQNVDAAGVPLSSTRVLSAGSALISKVGIDQTTAGSTNGVQTKQYTGVPSSFAILTADATVFTLAAGEIGFIQNLDDAALAVKKGASASTTSMSYLLAPCSAALAGDGGAVRIDDWVGAVSVAAMSGTASYLAYKQAP